MGESNQFEKRSLDDLVSLALCEVDEDAQWDIVFTIRDRLCLGAFERATYLCHSACPLERTLGARILGGGMPGRLLQECLDAVLALLQHEADSDVISAGLSALGNLRSRDFSVNVAVVESALRHLAHPNADVRYAVVHALAANLREDSIDALIQLTTDVDTEVRDWATFTLGTQLPVVIPVVFPLAQEPPQVQEALFKRLNDSDAMVCCEAIMGLATRGDRRVIPTLIEQFRGEEVFMLAVEAAELIRAPELYPALCELAKWWDVDDELLERAIAACSPA